MDWTEDDYSRIQDLLPTQRWNVKIDYLTFLAGVRVHYGKRLPLTCVTKRVWQILGLFGNLDLVNLAALVLPEGGDLR